MDVLTSTVTVFETDHSRTQQFRTFPIFGLPRGGTTAVAGCVRKMGVFIGNNLPVNLEDPEFSQGAMVTPKLVRSRNEEHDVWGWKFPNASNYLDAIMPALRNPRFIVVTRDQSANANAITSRHGAFDKIRALETVALQTQKNFSLIMRFRRPTMFVSYEKLLLKTEQTVREISEFLNVGTTDVQIAEAVRFVQPGVYQPVTD